MAKNGVALMCDKNGEKKYFPEDHPAAVLAAYVNEIGGTVTPRALGFKMTDKDGKRLAFCTPRKDNYVIYLTTIYSDNEILSQFDGVEFSKGSGGLAVASNLGNTPKAVVKMIRSIYAAAAEAAPEKPKKAKKAKKAKKEEEPEQEEAEEQPEEEEAGDAEEQPEEEEVPRKKKSKKVKKHHDEDEE